MGARPMLWGVLGALVVGFGGCGWIQPHVRSATGSPGSVELSYTIDHCRENLPVRVIESPTEVHLKVASYRSGNGGLSCLTGGVLTLEAALGTRTVIDDATGSAVPVEPPEQVRTAPG